MSEQEMLVNKMKCLHLEMLPECPPWRGNFHPSSFYNCSGKTRYSWWKLLWIIKIVFFLIKRELISMQCQPTNCFYHRVMLRVVCVCVGGSHFSCLQWILPWRCVFGGSWVLRERFPPTSGQSPCEGGGRSPHLVCRLRGGQDIPRVDLPERLDPRCRTSQLAGVLMPQEWHRNSRSSDPEEPQALGQCGLPPWPRSGQSRCPMMARSQLPLG